MSYVDRFRAVDDVSAHFDGVVANVNPYLASKYAGFFAVTSAAMLELALKDIVISFAKASHSLFGDYVASRYERISGRIAIDQIQKEHLKPFGSRFRDDFRDRLADREQDWLRNMGASVKSSYGNLITSRHSFAHEGALPANSTYVELKKGFAAGKDVMACLAETLVAR